METPKFVLCVPCGGINDMMVQIKYCLDYCKISGRECVIDTKRVVEFENNIFDFFDISDTSISSLSPSDFYTYVSRTPGLTVYPPNITPINLSTFTGTGWDDTRGCEMYKGFPLKLDKTRDNNESILVHFTSGGGNAASWFLKSFPPKPIILNELRRRHTALGENYLAIHVRNTDYTSDISGFLTTYDTEIRSAVTVFLSSDDPITVSTIKKIYGEKIHIFSKLTVAKPGIPQHCLRGKCSSFVVDAFCDLILLGLSTSYIYAFLTSNCKWRISGYSRNAHLLQQDPEFRAYYKHLLSA